MDEGKKILALCKKGEAANAASAIQRLKTSQMLQILKDCLLDGKSETSTLIKAIFDAYKDSKFSEKKVQIFTSTFQLINKEDIAREIVNNIVAALTMEIDTMDSKSLITVADHIINAVKTGQITSDKPLELFSKLLTTIGNHDSVPYNKDGCGEMDGASYKSHMLNNLCSCKWDSKVVVHLAAMFRDIQMKEEEMSFVVSKLIRMLNEVEHQEIPPLTYQLLLLSSKGQKEQVIKGLCDFFNSIEPVPTEDSENDLLNDSERHLSSNHAIQNVKGTVLLHITFAMKQDQDLARALLKFLRAIPLIHSSHGLTSFSIALALAAASIRRLQDTVFEFLKSTIVKVYKEAERQKISKVVQDLFPEKMDIEEQLLATVAQCKYGCDCVLEGLIQLSFVLLESGSAKFGDVTSNTMASPSSQACKLGGTILENIFKMHSVTREQILDQVLNIIATRTSQNIRQYVDLLSRLIAAVPQIILDCLPKFREIFDNLAMLKPETAEDVLRAVLPIMKVSMNIKDSLMLVLRKSMSARQVEARKVAAVGFLLILKHFKISVNGEFPMTVGSQAPSTQLFSCSQLQIATQGRYSANANESLCLEIIGCLRRCLSQQADVRLELYEGLYEVVCKNPPLSHAVLELLLSQVMKYYEKGEDITPPLKLEPCITATGDQVYLSEPLAHLLYSLQLCTSKSARRLDRDPEEDEMLSNTLDQCEELLQSLSRRMIKSELEDFELDKSADYSLSSSVGLKNNINSCLVLGTLEVLIEFNISKADLSYSACETSMQLYQNHSKLSQILKEKSTGAQGKKGKAGSSKQTSRSLLSLKSLAWMIHSIFSDTDSDHNEGLQLFRQSIEFCKFLVTLACQKLNQVLETGKCDGGGGKNVNHIFKQCCSLGRSFLQQLVGDTCLSMELVKKDKGKKISVMCLDGLFTTISIVCSQFNSRLPEFLGSLDYSRALTTQSSSLDSSSLIYKNIRRLQRMAINMFTSPDDDLGIKEGQQIINTIVLLTQHLDSQGNELTQVYNWLTRLCTEQDLDEISSTKAILGFLLNLHRLSQSSTKLIKQIAQDIHFQLGDIEEEAELEAQHNFAIINPKTAAPTAFVVLLNHLEKMIEEGDWLLTKLKSQRLLASKMSKCSEEFETEEEFTSKLDASLCYQLLGCIMAFHELTQTAFPEGSCADVITKVVTRLYTLLGNLSKYYLGLYQQKVGGISGKFEKLVKLTGTHLAQQVYAMITYMQASQNMHDQSVIEKGGKGKKKALSHEKNQAIKETRSIPNLIYSIEQYERYLIQLSKKSKINLMENFKRSTARDFRINGATLEAALHDITENGDGEEHDSNSILGDDQSDGVPGKRMKMTSNGLQ